MARSIAPGSSGFGNDTVGKSGSGSSWATTANGAGNPAPVSAALISGLPTPCMAVYATEISRAPPGRASPHTRAR